jgi:hypothetical protein
MIVWTGSEFKEWDDYAIRGRGLPDYAREATPEEAALYRHGQVRIKALEAALRLFIEWHNDTGVVMWDVLIDVARAALEGEASDDAAARAVRETIILMSRERSRELARIYNRVMLERKLSDDAAT